MRTLLLLTCLLLLVPPVHGQDGASDVLLASERLPVQITIVPVYQSYESDDAALSQFTLPVSVSIPIGRRTRARLLVNQASVTGDGLTGITGLSNAQVGLAHSLGYQFLTMQMGVNVGIPSGTTGFSEEEFTTTRLLSRNSFGFAMPGFGQGLTVAPHVVIASQLAGNFVLGLGFTYVYKGSYDPMEAIVGYDPGDEMLFTIGLDFAVSRSSSFAVNASYSLYQGDTWADNPDFDFEAGPKVSVLAQFRRLAPRSELLLRARYRTQDDAVLGGIAIPGAAPPSLMEAGISWTLRLTDAFATTVRANARAFGEVGDCDVNADRCLEAETLGRVGVVPTLRLSRALSLITRVGATFGSITGFEGGIGLQVRL